MTLRLSGCNGNGSSTTTTPFGISLKRKSTVNRMMMVCLEHNFHNFICTSISYFPLGTLQEQWPFWNAMEFVRTSPGSDGPRKIVKCDLCPYVCSSGSSLRHRRNMLRYHMKGVHGPKNLVCDYCGAKYSKFQPNAFKDHVNAVHLKLKPYKCNVEGCDYTCGFNSRYKF